MFVITVEFEVKPEHVDDFRNRIFQQAADSLNNEADCHQFDVCFGVESPTTCFLYEKYTDRAAFDHHLTTDYFKSFDAAAGPWIDSKKITIWRSDTTPL